MDDNEYNEDNEDNEDNCLLDNEEPNGLTRLDRQ